MNIQNGLAPSGGSKNHNAAAAAAVALIILAFYGFSATAVFYLIASTLGIGAFPPGSFNVVAICNSVFVAFMIGMGWHTAMKNAGFTMSSAEKRTLYASFFALWGLLTAFMANKVTFIGYSIGGWLPDIGSMLKSFGSVVGF
ncbi:hypothetical protein G3A39_41235 [Paraburkholderia aspalathi]|nr:hypothetical protein [Paraburkholderia aspalathi]